MIRNCCQEEYMVRFPKKDAGFWKEGSRHGHGHIVYASLEDLYKGIWMNDFPGELNLSNSIKKSRYQKPKNKVKICLAQSILLLDP